MQGIAMKTVFRPYALGALLLLAMSGARAQVINFETSPPLPLQPDNFAAAGPMQTYTLAGVYSITGGVVLGNPTFLAAFPAHGSAPNLYGTTDIADPSLLDTITLTFPSSELVVSVTGLLFNGQTIAEDYTVTAFSGAAVVATQNFSGVPDDSDSSAFANISLASSVANPITSVTITTPNVANNGWDFFVDSLQLTTGQSPTVPEPGALALLAGLAAPGAMLLRRRK